MNLRIIIDITLDNLIVLIKSINNKISHTFFNREETKVFLHYSYKNINIYVGIIQVDRYEYYIICKETVNDIYRWAEEIARTEPFFDFNLNKDLIYQEISPPALSANKIILLDLFTHKKTQYHIIILQIY